MSHIINNNKDIEKLLFILDFIRKSGIDLEILEESLRIMLPKESTHIINYRISKTTFDSASFIPLKKLLCFSLKNIDITIKKIIKIVQTYCEKCSYEDLYGYIYFHIISHEIEHVYEYLIGKNIVDNQYDVVIDYYKQIYDMSYFHLKYFLRYIRTLPLAFKKNKTILERNVDIEAFDLMYQVANYENNYAIKSLTHDLKQNTLIIGYEGKYNGIIEEAYQRKLFVTNLSLCDDSIPIVDKVRYGLPLDEYTKKKVINHEFE